MQYVVRWRMHVALERLRADAITVTDLVSQLGHESEAASTALRFHSTHGHAVDQREETWQVDRARLPRLDSAVLADQHELSDRAVEPQPSAYGQPFQSIEVDREPQYVSRVRQIAHGDDQEIAVEHVRHLIVERCAERGEGRTPLLGVRHVENEQSMRPAIGR
jgi:hypothetical protein